MMKYILFFLGMLSTSILTAQSSNLHSDFDKMLSQYVSTDGNVDYSAWKKDIARLDSYLDKLGNSSPADDWSSEKKLAYWINAYNAFTIKLILDNYPVTSITELEGGKPWDKQWIKIGSNTYSLNNIENDIIRPVFNDPRIHFAVNCAAKSCPPLANKAYTASNLDALLESRTKAFINDTLYNQLGKKKLVLSKIFEWYAADFGDLNAFIAKYAEKNIDKNASVSHNEYNWALNTK